MRPIEFSAVHSNEVSTQQLFVLLKQFEQKYRCNLQIHVIAWENIWQELIDAGVYRRSLDVSEIGTTWIKSLISMNSLQPISLPEIDLLSGKLPFIESTWRSVEISDEQSVWAIPFRADVRVIYYWADLLEQAGIEAGHAFETPAAFHETIARVHRLHPYPLGMSTNPQEHNTLFQSASWVWARGGDFTSPTERKSALLDPKTLAGLHEYYDLYRFTPQGIGYLNDLRAVQLFIDRRVAVLISGPWVLNIIKRQPENAVHLHTLGIALPPGQPFVGGTCLIAWRYNLIMQCTFDLMHYLVSPKFQAAFCPMTGLLPVCKEVWLTPSMAEDRHYQVLYQALNQGRSFPAIQYWGVIESQLKLALGHIWQRIIQSPGQDLDNLLIENLEPLESSLTKIFI